MLMAVCHAYRSKKLTGIPTLKTPTNLSGRALPAAQQTCAPKSFPTHTPESTLAWSIMHCMSSTNWTSVSGSLHEENKVETNINKCVTLAQILRMLRVSKATMLRDYQTILRCLEIINLVSICRPKTGPAMRHNQGLLCGRIDIDIGQPQIDLLRCGATTVPCWTGDECLCVCIWVEHIIWPGRG